MVPISAELTTLADDLERLTVEQVFQRYIDAYLALYAAGQVGELLIERLTDMLEKPDRAAILEACRTVVDRQVNQFSQELFGG